MKWRCMCLVIHAPEDLRLEERDAGEIGPGQVLVRVGMGGICGSDLHYFHDGGFGTVRIKEPLILGHEAAGTVVEVGEGVGSVSAGDHVVPSFIYMCGKCRFWLNSRTQPSQPCCGGRWSRACRGPRCCASRVRFPNTCTSSCPAA